MGAIALAVAACSRGGDAAAGPLVRDSAGITIVENREARPGWTAPWILSEEPVLRIGSAESDPSQLLFQVTDARRLDDGRVLVVNSGSAEVKVFDPDGRLLRTLGRRGDGPGEFRAPWHAYPMVGDSILVVDLYREVAVFDPDGAYARQFTPALPDGLLVGEGAAPVDQFGDGSLLLKGHYPQDPSRQGVGRNRIPLLRSPLDGSTVTSLGDFDDQTVHYGLPSRDLAFGAWAHQAAADSTLWYGPGDRFELQEVALDGTVRTLVRLDRPARPVTESDQDDYRREYVEAMARWNPGRGDELWQSRARDALFPDSFPAHFQIETDAGGNVWVQDYRSLYSESRTARRWTVFDATGVFLGDVVVPGGLTVHDIGDDHLVGVWTDEYGVEYLHVHRIVKPSG
ncbi:MAG: hypothetical protein RH859_04985 [Longimicrobiales bacterium]